MTSEVAHPGFVKLFGHVQYRSVMTKERSAWRRIYASRHDCEIRDCSQPGVVFDHCHNHGFVRGAVCYGCNVRLGQIDAVVSLAGVTVDFGDNPYGRHLAQCPGCSGSPRLPADLQFLPPMYRAPEAKRRRRALLVSPGPPVVRRKDPQLGHLSLTGRTVCGRNIERYVPADIAVTMCKACIGIVSIGKVF